MSTHGRSKTRREFLRDGAILGAAASVGPGLLAACGTSSSGTSGVAKSGRPSRKNTLFVSGWQSSPPVNFNPLAARPDWPNAFPTAAGQHMLVYESLFGFDTLSGGIKPVLGKSVSYPDATTAVVQLHPEAHWQDGKALTADDVVYTFRLAKEHSDLNYATVWTYVSDVVKKDDHTVQFALNPDNVNSGQLRHFLATVPILPQHVWTAVESKSGSLLSQVDMKPVGSGPYKLYDQNQQRIALVRDDSYWGKGVYGVPAPAYLIHPILKSNDDISLAFQSGELDYSQSFIPQIWQMWEQKHLPVSTWLRQPPYHLPGSIPLLLLNVHRKGLDNVNVRRALAHAIDYEQIAATAMSRYSVPARASLVIPDGPEKKFFASNQAQQMGWAHDPQKAVQLLESAGATKGGDGIYRLPDGTRLGPWKLQCPYGWTDWMTSLQVVQQSAKAVGIELTTNFPEVPQFFESVYSGNYDMVQFFVTGLDPSAPWARFRDVLDIRGVPPLGQAAFWDTNRFSDPSVPSLLGRAGAAASSDVTRLFAQLDAVFQNNVPAIPLEYRPFEFFEYNETAWTGFPNSKNPYAPPTMSGAGVRWLFKVRTKG